MPVLPHDAPPPSSACAAKADLALTEPDEWPRFMPPTLEGHTRSVEHAHPGLAVGAALLAVALLVTALDPSARAGAAHVQACPLPARGSAAVPAEHGSGPPRRARLVRTP